MHQHSGAPEPKWNRQITRRIFPMDNEKSFGNETIVRHAVYHFRLLLCKFLHHSLIQKLFANYSARRHGTNCRTSSMATARTETTHGPTYSMTRGIGATHGEKVSSVDAIVYVATVAHSQWKSLVTWTDLSNGHINEHVGESATSV